MNEIPVLEVMNDITQNPHFNFAATHTRLNLIQYNKIQGPDQIS